MSEGNPKNRVSKAFFDEFEFPTSKGQKAPKIPKIDQQVTDASWEGLLSQHPDMEAGTEQLPDSRGGAQDSLSLEEVSEMGKSTNAQVNVAFTGDLDELPSASTIPNSFYIQFFDPDDLPKDEDPVEPEVSFRKRDPTYVQDVIRLTARSKLISYFRGESQEGRIFTELISDNRLNLTPEEKSALQMMLHMGTEIIFSDPVIIAEAKRQICEKIGIYSGLIYSFNEIVEMAKKYDAIFCQQFTGSVFGDMSKENVVNISCVDNNKYTQDAVFNFATMAPPDRRIWILKTNPIREEVEQNLMSALGIVNGVEYSIEDLKEFADRFDHNGRQGSGLISLMHLPSYNALEVHEKKFTYREAMFFVLMPKEGRIRWLGLQVTIK